MGIDLKTRNPVPLTEAQNKILSVFRYVKGYLDENSIKSFLLGGSLLGAVRHQGFIPWDDDIDIGLIREDYERFLADIQNHLPEYLQLRTYWDESNHHYYFARIVDTRYVMRREGSLVSRDENVWVDIFPLDGMPNRWLSRKIHMLKLLWVRMRYHIACFEKVNLKRPHRPFSERVVIKIIKITRYREKKNYVDFLEKLDALLKKYSVLDTNWVVNFMGQYKFKEMFPKSYYGDGKLYPFEDMHLMGPENYDAVLSQMYGAYMQVPKNCDMNVHAAHLVKEENP